MKPFIFNLINALTLIILGLWAYFGAENPSFTALIPVIAGGIFLILSPGVKKENKVVAHIVVLLTLIIFIALFKPLTAAISRSDTLAIVRVTLMMLTSLLALISYVKSFIDARRK